MTRSLVSMLLLSMLVACRKAGEAAPTGSGGTLDLGLAARVLVGAGDLWLVQGRESEQGARDANGDGDALDEVLSVLDLRLVGEARLRATGLALGGQDGEPPLLACDGTGAAWAVDEAAQGGIDLNGDGDALDRVLFVLDRERGTCTNLGLAVDRILVGGSLVACAVDEYAQGGTDLDVDGDATGSVLAVHDLEDRSTTVFSLRDSAPLLVHDRRVALRLAEREGLDLTGDGDDQDQSVLEVYDGRTHLLQNTTLVLAGEALSGVGGILAFAVSERGQGRGDLSGDGDTDDWVLHVYDPRRGFSVNLGLSPPLYPAPAVDGQHFVIFAREAPSQLDANQDGDLDDLVVFVFEPASGILINTGLASQGSAALFGDWLGVSVSEAMQGAADLDLDGEADGNIVHVIELATGFLENLRLDAFSLHGGIRRLYLTPSENLQDRFLADWSSTDGRTHRGTVVGAVLDVQEDLALVQTAERETGIDGNIDGNGDGDTDDLLLELYDSDRGRIPLGLAVGSVARLLPGRRVLALIDEDAQGLDLNGDGDHADEVLFLSTVP